MTTFFPPPPLTWCNRPHRARWDTSHTAGLRQPPPFHIPWIIHDLRGSGGSSGYTARGFSLKQTVKTRRVCLHAPDSKVGEVTRQQQPLCFLFFFKKRVFFFVFFFREKVEFNFQAYAFLTRTHDSVSRSRTFRKGRRERFMLHFVAQYYFRGPRKHLVHKMELRKNIRSWSLLCCETNSLTWKPRNGFGITQFPYYYHNYFQHRYQQSIS